MQPELIVLAGPAGFAGGAVLGLTAFDSLRRRAVVARRVVAAAAAIAAVPAGPAASGLDVWDAALRAALAAGFVLLAARSRPVWWIPAAALAAAGSGGGPLLAAALAVLGAAVALAATARRLPVAGAVVGALLVQLALRLERPQLTGATALLAAAVLLPVAASGFRRSPRADRRAVVRLGLAAGGVVVVGGAAGVAGALLARGNLEKGTSALAGGVEAVRGGDEEATARALSAASRSFRAARSTLDAGWLLPARLVPVVAPHLAALQQGARTGEELALTGAETVAASDLGGLAVRGGRLDLGQVRELHVPVSRAAAALDEARRDLARVAASPWLLPAVSRRVDVEVARLDRSHREASIAAAVTEYLPALLGGSGPRRYFLAIQTPAELRGSGGIIGSFGEVTADDGQLAIGAFGRDGDLNTRGTPAAERTLSGPDDYVARYARFEPQRIWQNVSMSPHFPAVAEVISRLYPQSGGSAVDGVISIDPSALAALLELVGPVTVAPWPEPLTAANTERILLHDQYVRLDPATRPEFLGDVADAVATRLTTGALPPPAAIVQALGPAVRGHHLALWSPVAAEQALFRRIGADGGLPPVDGDGLAVVNVNAGGNKLDWFLRRTSDYRARVDPDTGRVTGTLTVELRNDSPASGLPPYVIGSSLPVPVGPDGTNRTYLSVYTPLGLSGARLDGEPVALESGRETGRNVFSLFLNVPPGATATLSIDLAGRITRGRTYRLAWRAQALPVPEVASARVTVGGRTLVARPSGPLEHDETLAP